MKTLRLSLAAVALVLAAACGVSPVEPAEGTLGSGNLHAPAASAGTLGSGN